MTGLELVESVMVQPIPISSYPVPLCTFAPLRETFPKKNERPGLTTGSLVFGYPAAYKTADFKANSI